MEKASFRTSRELFSGLSIPILSGLFARFIEATGAFFEINPKKEDCRKGDTQKRDADHPNIQPLGFWKGYLSLTSTPVMIFDGPALGLPLTL